MDIKQQTKNVAAQGRFGDSMLLHVNPAEVKGLASAMPITTNPETGQPEAFLPFLAPMLGSLVGSSLLTGAGAGALGGLIGVKGLSAAAAAGIGAGLASYAQTGGSGSKALLSGLTAGLGAKALNTAAQGLNPEVIEPIATGGVLPTDTAASNIVSQVAAVNPNIPAPVVTPSIDKFSSLRDTGAQLFSGGLDEGLKNIAGAAMTPTGMLAAGAAGTGAVMESQAEFERQMAQMQLDEEERKRRMYEMYPEQIPIATGGSTNFADGKSTSIDAKNNYLNYLREIEQETFKLSRRAPGENPTGLPVFGARDKIRASQNYIQARKDVVNALRNLTDENLAAYERGDFKNLSTGIAKDEIEKYKNFVSSTNIVNQVKDVNKSSGGTIGFQRGRNINISYDPRETNNFNPGSGEYYVPGGRAQTTTRRARPIIPGFMAGFSPEYRYFQGNDPSTYLTRYARDIQDSSNPQDFGQSQFQYGGFRPPMPLQSPFMPRFGGFNNPFMQSPSYQSFYGNPQMGGMYNPYARFNQQPIQPYYGYQPPQTPPPPDVPPPDDIPPPSDGGDLPPPDVPIIPPIDDGIGRKGRTRNVEPVSPPDDFITPGPIRTADFQDSDGNMIDDRDERPVRPIPEPMPFNPPIDMKPRQTIEDNPPFIKDTPPPTITIPIEGGADVTIPDFSKINIPNPRDDFMSINRISEPRDEFISSMPNENPVSFAASSISPPMIAGLEDRDATPFVPPIVPPVQSVTTPQPIGQAPRPVQEPVEMTTITRPNLLGEMQTVNIGNYNLPSGPITPSEPVDPRIGTGIKMPSGPAMGSISAVPTPTAPTPTMPRPPMSGGIFGAPMFAEGGDTDLPNKGLEALAKTEKGREAVEAMGYQEGQDINMPTGQSTDMMMQDPIVQEVIQFILGETDNNEIINEFIIKYGQEQLMMLRDMVLKQAAGNPDVQTEGLIEGNGNSGMADDLPMNIGNKAIAAVSQDEYIIPADVVSMLGDGSSDAGSKQLDGMLDRVRMAKTGGKTQAAPLNPEKVLPA